MATSNKHGKQTIAQGIHGTIAYEYADATARLAASGFQAEDLYKQAIQLNDKSVWILTSISPITWAAVGSNPSLVQGISAGTAQANGPTIVFSNANGVSFGANGSTITASVQPSGLAGFIAGTETASSGTLSFQNGNGVTFGISGSIMTASILPGAAAGIGAVQGGTQTQTSGTLAFANSNGVTFGMSGSSQITASYTVPSTAGLISNVNISAGTTSNNLTNFVFSNSNNVSFGLNGSTITGSIPNQTSLSFSNSNGLSFGIIGSTLTGSYTVPTQTQFLFSNSNGVTFGTAGSTVTASVAAQTANIFSNANGISFGTNGSTVTASYTVPTQSSLSFSNANGVSFGLNGSTLTATVSAQSNQTAGLYAIGNTTGQSSNSTFDMRTVSISGAGNVSIGYSGNALIVSGAGGNGSVNISAGTTSNNLNALTFSNSNGISFGLNGSTITGSYSTLVFSNSNGISFGINAGTLTATVQPGAAAGVAAIQAGTQTATSGTVSFANSNGISFGMSGSSQITASYTVPSTAGLISNINVSAGTTSNNLTAITFSNSNGMSFGLNGSTITGSYTVPTQTNQTVGLYGLGNTTQSSSTTIDARSLSFNGLGAMTVGYSNGSIQLSVPTQTVQTQSLIAGLYDGANSISTGTIRVSNANGVSFGINGQTLTASVAVQSNQTAGLYGLGNTTQNSSTTLDVRSLSFNGLGAATIGYSNGSIQVSVPVQTVQTQSNIQAIYDGAASISTGTIRYSNSNGISFGINGQTITASHNAITSQTNQTVGLYGLGNTTQNSSTTLDARSLSFNGLGNITVGYSNGSIQLSGSQTSQTQNIVVPSAGTQTATSGTVVYSNSNNITFGMSGSSRITASYNFNLSAGTTSNNLNAITFSNSNGVSFGLNGSVVTASVVPPSGAIINVSAGTTSNDVTALTFSNANNVSFGLNGSVITASVIPPSGAVINISAGTTSNNVTALTFSNSNGLAFGLNGSTITGSYTVPTQTNQTEGLYAIGNTTGQSSSSTFDARTMSVSGAGNISVGYSGNALVISGSAANGNINISAGTTSNNLTNFVFSNSNNVSFGLNGSTVTATVTVVAQTNQTQGFYAVGNTTGQSSSSTIDARSISFNGAGNVSVGYSAGSVVISGNTQTVQTQNIVLPSAGTQTATSGTVVFSNSNGISFGMSNSSVITASYTVPTQTNQTVGLYGLGNTTQNSSTTLDARSLSFNGLGIVTVGYSNGSIQISATQSAQTQSNIQAIYDGVNSISTGTIRFSNINGVSFGVNGQTITASHNALTNINVSAGTTSNNLNALTFSNSNGLSFGLNGSTITGSYTVPTQTNQTVGLYATGNTTQSSSTTLDARSITFNAIGAATLGFSNGSVQVSVPVQSAQTQSLIQAIYDGAASITTGTIRFSNSNGVSFGINGQTITASHNGITSQTAQTVGLYGLGNTTQNSSTTLDARSLSFNGLGNITVGYSNGSIQLSGSQSVQTSNIVVPSAGTQTATSGTVIFSNSNGISFGMSNSSVITASYTVPTQTNQTVGLYGLGNTTQNSSTTIDARSLSFNGLGIVTVGYSNGSIQVSATQSAQTQSVIQAIYDGVNSISTGTIRYSNSNGVSFGINGQTITASINALTNINVSAGTTSNNLTAITFSNSNGLSFGLNGSTITGSYTVPTQSNQTEGLYAIGNTIGQSSSSTFDARTVSISGAGIVSVGYSGNALVISAPSAGGSINISAGTTSNNLNALTFSNANNVSFGLNGSVITGSIAPALSFFGLGNTTQNSSTSLDGRSISLNGLGAMTVGYSNGSIQLSSPVVSNLSVTGALSASTNGSTIILGAPVYNASQLIHPANPWQTNFQISNASFSLQRFNPYLNITATQANFLMALSGNTNSSGALTVSFGIYTMNGSTMSLASSSSRQISWTSGSQTTNSTIYGGVSGTRYRTISLNNWNITGGDYILGLWFRTTNNGTWLAFGQQGPTIVGALDSNETNNYGNGFSTSSYTTAMISSINVTDTNYVRTGGNALQQPGVIFLGNL